ncbi:MAG: hypothetical protein ACRDGQ_06755 [Candidatus Limnocylindrales bacterium]
MRLGPLTISRTAKAAPPVQAAYPGTSWDAVRTSDLSGLARRVINEDLGPGVPISPAHPEKVEPRLFDYTPGYNIAITPRTYENIQFAALRGLARSWDVAALCIQRNIDDLRQLRWEIRPKAVPGMDRDAVKARRIRLESTRAGIEGFWMTPDQQHSWSSWVHQFFEELYETDAACLYLEEAQDGSLYAVQNVDGTTIAPLVDERGRTPAAPEPAYRQVIRGMPWTMYMQDLELPPAERRLSYDRSHMIYEPFYGRNDSPYGHPPMEWVLLTAQRALARQVLDYRLFNDGTTPYSFWRTPEGWTDAQIGEAQTAFDKLIQLPTQRAHLRFMPGGAGSGLEHGFMEPKTEGEEFLLHIGCAAYNRSPMEMGFIRSSGGAGLGGKGVAKEQGASAAKSVRAAAFHLAAIINRIIALHQNAECEIVFPELEDTEAAKERAEAEDIRIRNGSLGIDEARLDRDLDPIGPAGHPSNLIWPGGPTFPELAATLLAGPPPEPPPGGANPPVPSAVPGRATDTATVAKSVHYQGDLARIVHEYLLRSYPPKDVAWALDPAIDWEYDKHVALADINMARRPGGRNPQKVESMADTLGAGASMDPVILADFGEPEGLRIADGFHRTLGAEQAGESEVPALIARKIPEQYRAVIMGPMQADSASVRKAHLQAWQRKATRALKAGGSAAVPFDSAVLARDDRIALTIALKFAHSPDQVRAIFDVLGGEKELVKV